MTDHPILAAPISLPLFRHTPARMVPDDKGEWVHLTKAQHALNAMQSQLRSAGLGALPPGDLKRQAHQARGDILRIWEIIGNPNTQGMKQDIFQRLQMMMDLLQQTRLDLQVTRLALDAKILEHEPKKLPAPTAEEASAASASAPHRAGAGDPRPSPDRAAGCSE